VSSGQDTGARVSVTDAPPGYVLGPGDQFVLEVPDLEELNGKTHRIDSDGTVSLPLVGRVQAAGYTLPAFEKALDAKLLTQLKEPHITVTVTEILSQPVTVIGEVNNPGTHQIRGPQPLTEVLSLAGGLKNDAGYRITITRRKKYGALPLKDARIDAKHNTSTGEVSVSDILEARNPEENIEIQPYDVVTVPRAKLIYVMGEVKKPGGFTLEQHDTVSILQVLAMAEGLTPSASKKKTIIMREEPGADRRAEIHLDLAKVMNGKDPQINLRPNDILYVPKSGAHELKMRAIEAAIATGSGILIWRAAL
jgi:polysaccharide biosynthesis/export protein